MVIMWGDGYVNLIVIIISQQNVYQITTLYTLELYNVICQLYFHISWERREKLKTQTKQLTFVSSPLEDTDSSLLIPEARLHWSMLDLSKAGKRKKCHIPFL